MFVVLNILWPLRGWGWWGLSESVKKGKFITKIFFQIILNDEALKKL